MNNIIRSIKKISTGLIFTMDKELANNNIYTSYAGVYKNKKCTVFKYKGVYSTIAEESYPLLKYVQDLLYIVPEILAYQKQNSSFYIVTDRILPIVKQEEASSICREYKVFNEFMSTNVSHINNTLLKKHSIILTSLKNITTYSNINLSEMDGSSMGVSEEGKKVEKTRMHEKHSLTKSKDMPCFVNIDYADIYYDCNNNTKAMVLPIFTTENNVIYNPNNIIYKIHKVLHTDDYPGLYNSLVDRTDLLPPHYTKYIINVLFVYIEKNKIKTSEVQAAVDKCENKRIGAKAVNSKGALSTNGNENLSYVVQALMLFDVSPYYDLLNSYTNTSIIYIVMYIIRKNLYSLSLADINGVFTHICNSISKYINSKYFESLVIELLFEALPVLSNTNRMLFIELFIKQDIIAKTHSYIKNNLSVLMEVENIYSLLIHLLSSKCLISYRLGVFIIYNNIERISIESILLQVIEIVSKKCLKDEITNESVQLLKYLVDYINNNISEIKKSKGVKIKRQRPLKKREIEDEWSKRNQMHINKIANTSPAKGRSTNRGLVHTDWSNSEW